MRLTRCVAAMVYLALGISSANAYAQTSSTGLVNLMLNTFDQRLILATTPGGVGVVAHTAVFSEDPRLAATRALVTNVSQQLGSQISTFPLGSSSGGFTYSYDPALGTFSRTTQTFGPAFAERAASIGRGKFSVGMNFVHATYDTLDGKDLQNGDIKFNLFHQRLSPPSYVEGDVIEAALVAKLTSDTTTLLFNFGVTDRLDVGLAVPIVRVSMDLTYRATILDFSTGTVSPSPHLFANGTKTADFNASGSASGVGDIVVRGKYAFLGNGGQGLAVGLDVRLPSGDEANMLGSGATQTKIFLIGSSVVGNRLAPHVNVGYTVSSGGTDVSDQFNAVGGLEIRANPRVTFVGDIISRTFRNTFRLEDGTTSHSFQQGPTGSVATTTLQTTSVLSGNLTSVLGAAGVKLNPVGNLLISAHVLFPLNESGLRSRVTPVVGFDYSF